MKRHRPHYKNNSQCTRRRVKQPWLVGGRLARDPPGCQTEPNQVSTLRLTAWAESPRSMHLLVAHMGSTRAAIECDIHNRPRLPPPRVDGQAEDEMTHIACQLVSKEMWHLGYYCFISSFTLGICHTHDDLLPLFRIQKERERVCLPVTWCIWQLNV